MFAHRVLNVIYIRNYMYSVIYYILVDCVLDELVYDRELYWRYGGIF